MTTTFKFSCNGPMALAKLTSDDGGKAFVWCAIPGGRPQFQFDLASPHVTAVDGAPEILTLKDFRKFVRARWAD